MYTTMFSPNWIPPLRKLFLVVFFNGIMRKIKEFQQFWDNKCLWVLSKVNGEWWGETTDWQIQMLKTFSCRRRQKLKQILACDVHISREVKLFGAFAWLHSAAKEMNKKR